MPSQRTSRPAVRIIGGRWKRTPLPVADLPGLRPTPDRVRETLFNWLTHQFGGGLEGLRVLDLFAGTGVLGFEAASRGAAQVVMVESHPQALTALRAAQAKLNAGMIDIRSGDAMTAVKRMRTVNERFDIVFLDPPYRQGWLERLLPEMTGLLSGQGQLYVEAEAPLDARQLAGQGLETLRQDRAGQVFYHLLRCDIKNQDKGEVSC